MAEEKAQAGKWYLGVVCPHCGRGLAIEECPSPEEQPELMATMTPRISIDCHQCGRRVELSSDQVVRMPGVRLQ